MSAAGCGARLSLAFGEAIGETVKLNTSASEGVWVTELVPDAEAVADVVAVLLELWLDVDVELGLELELLLPLLVAVMLLLALIVMLVLALAEKLTLALEVILPLTLAA